MKLCKCKDHTSQNPLPYEMFGLNSRKADGYDYYCKACRSAYHKALYQRQQDKIKQRVSEWQQQNAKAVRETASRYRKNNPEQRAASGKKWRDSNKSTTCHLANKRRALKLQATPPWFENEKVAQLYENCATGYHVHHIVPLQEDPIVCGLHCLANLVIVSEREHVAIHSDMETLRSFY